MESKIMQDNILYLQEWKKYNPDFIDKLFIENDQLIYQNNNKIQKISINNFYLPNILYNQTLREHLKNCVLSPYDLFLIIEIEIKAQKLNNQKQNEIAKYPAIINITKKDDYLIIIDENQKKYRYDTKEPDKVLQLFGLLKAQNDRVTIKDLTNAIKPEEKKDLITYEKYTSLIQKSFLTENEKQEILDFEKFMLQIKKYAPYVNLEALELFKNYQNFYEQAINFPNLIPTLQEGIYRYKNINNLLSLIEEKEKRNEKEENLLLERKLKEEKKAGYADGVILLFVVFNLGMFLACLLLFFR